MCVDRVGVTCDTHLYLIKRITKNLGCATCNIYVYLYCRQLGTHQASTGHRLDWLDWSVGSWLLCLVDWLTDWQSGSFWFVCCLLTICTHTAHTCHMSVVGSLLLEAYRFCKYLIFLLRRRLWDVGRHAHAQGFCWFLHVNIALLPVTDRPSNNPNKYAPKLLACASAYRAACRFRGELWTSGRPASAPSWHPQQHRGKEMLPEGLQVHWET